MLWASYIHYYDTIAFLVEIFVIGLSYDFVITGSHILIILVAGLVVLVLASCI